MALNRLLHGVLQIYIALIIATLKELLTDIFLFCSHYNIQIMALRSAIASDQIKRVATFLRQRLNTSFPASIMTCDSLNQQQKRLGSKMGYSTEAGGKYVPRRAMMYVPGNDEKKLRKLTKLDVDCACMDCEDGVAINRKVGTFSYKFSINFPIKSDYLAFSFSSFLPTQCPYLQMC